MVNIFIANLDWEITSDDLMTTFSSFGNVNYAHVVYEKETKRSKGFGYVEMESAEEAIAAITALNGMEINGRKLDVKVASPKGNRPPKKEAEPKKQFKKKPFQKGGGFQKKPYDNRAPRQSSEPRPIFSTRNESTGGEEREKRPRKRIDNSGNE